MKKIFILYLFLLSCNTSHNISYIPSPKEQAQDTIQHHLDIISNKVFNNSDSSMIFMRSVSFLEACSNIISSADGTTLGKITVHLEDLEKWQAWYNTNKENVIWNVKEKKISICEE